MIESHDCVEEHEQRFGNLENIFHFPSCPRLEISNTVIAHIANGSSSEWGQYEARDDGFSVLCQLLLEQRQRVTLGSMTRTGLQYLSWVYVKEISLVRI